MTRIADIRKAELALGDRLLNEMEVCALLGVQFSTLRREGAEELPRIQIRKQFFYPLKGVAASSRAPNSLAFRSLDHTV